MIDRMGRKRKNPDGLPNRVYKKGPSYYYVTPQNRWIRLGKTQPDMLRALAELHDDKPRGLNDVIARYRTEVMPRKAPGTRKMQDKQLDLLARAFGHMAPAAIRPVHIAQYHDKRGKTAPVTANRELALMSHLMRFAVRIGRCESNPCTTIQRHPEKPRDRYVTNDEYNAVWQQAPAHMRVLIDLAYLTGQRQAALVNLHRNQLHDDGIHFEPMKGGRRLIVSWSDNLRAVIGAANQLSDIASLYVVCQANGQKYTSSGVQTAWQRLMRQCVASGIVDTRYTFHDLRAKAGSDVDDGRLLGHMSDATLKRVYRRAPLHVKPVR